ncbi:MBL fold metallo-hydrolase [Alicyclobacillus fastidiosus]|uniref:MBL fold metallo-hydrolase n=1 Tax=Alicyclobacillus fastidiosus TaxID=392011 RepID=A0ABY6ZME3_9BACL|nr:MBL fold metallo-hydrolase [Alicyclobacillus fastidiosus]WAH44007.1 MBL fold metallo-hydrolase [Alicyclobacillus fastidiosus]GMA60289.1 MBL fold metallo-hydrolase [Alicyclobacillus fastidiosus]
MTQTLHYETLSEHVVRVELPTPTLPPLESTNTYVVYQGAQAVVIDCGSGDPALIEQLANWMRGRGICEVLAYVATHYHIDHTQGIPLLCGHFPGPIYVHPMDHTGAAKAMQCAPDVLQNPPDALVVGDVRIEISHTPGHTHGHLHLWMEREKLMFVGDHMSGQGTVWIGPPDGHMDDYYAALVQIEQSDAHLVLPGHGPTIASPQSASRALRQHRLAREQEILTILEQAPKTTDQIVELIYGDRGLGAALWVAKRTIQAHLARLIDLGQVKRHCAAPDFQIRYAIHTPQEGTHL